MSIENEINTPPEEQVDTQDASTHEETGQGKKEEQVEQKTSASPSEEEEQAPVEQEAPPSEERSETAPEEIVSSTELPSKEPDPEGAADSAEEDLPTEEEAAPQAEQPPGAEKAVEVAQGSASEEPASEEPAAEGSTEPSAEGAGDEPAPPVEEQDPEVAALLQRIDEVLESPDVQVLDDISSHELTRVLLVFGHEEDIRQLIPKVGLIERSFEALKGKEDVPEEDLQAFETALVAFNKRRSDYQQQEEVFMAHNAERKKALIVKLQELTASEDPAQVQQQVRDLQDEWKDIGIVSKDEMETLNKQYRGLLDDFYKRRELHFELRDYDRRINLQEKEKLIEEAQQLPPAAEDLFNEQIWKQKMDAFTEIQKKWRSVGHVPREDMDRINEGYRQAIDKFFEIREDFKKHQDKIRQENAEKKEEILRMMEKFREFEADKPRAWNDATQELRTYQEAWKQIGQAPNKQNNALWSRYRELCDAFFGKKSTFFKGLDELRNGNLEAKRELCERAEELKESTQWEKTARELKQLQKKWKAVGPVPERHSNKLWNRFRSACDQFFDHRRKHYEALHADEHDNLESKRKLIKEVEQLIEDDEADVNASIQKVKELQAQWKTIGRVPYKEKDVIWEEFRGVVDKFFNGLSLKRDEIRSIKLKSSINMMSGDKRTRTIRSKMAQVKRKIQQAQEKVDQYETNILYISKGKSGDPLREQIQKEIDREKDLIVGYRKRIKEMNEMLKNPPKEEKKETTDQAATEETATSPAADSSESAPAADAPAAEVPSTEASAEAPQAEKTQDAEQKVAKETTREAPPPENEAAQTESPEAGEAAKGEEPAEVAPSAEADQPAAEAPKTPEAPAPDGGSDEGGSDEGGSDEGGSDEGGSDEKEGSKAEEASKTDTPSAEGEEEEKKA